MRIDARDLVPSAETRLITVAHGCVCCGRNILGEPRAVFISIPIQFPEDAEHVEVLSRNGPTVYRGLCRAKSCAAFLSNPRLPKPLNGVVFQESVYHRGRMCFLDGPVIERLWPSRTPMFFGDLRSLRMKRYLRDDSRLQSFCAAAESRGLRCVGAWSGQDDIDAVYHYACLFSQETAQTLGVWVPYWYRDTRLIGSNRVAYLIKGAESYRGAVVMDTVKRSTLTWVWLTPSCRRRGVFTATWRQLEYCHPGFSVLAPLADSMRCFLKHEDPNGLHRVVEETGSDSGNKSCSNTRKLGPR